MKPATKSASAYRPDIDGLRALAVLAVLFFHADLGCTGGFVGVDIFFVISGFLITSLLLHESAAGTFSLINFWERRIRRIVPAWTVVALVSLVVGWFLFLPPDFVTLGTSAIAQAMLLSNVFFWQQTRAGYFAASPDTLPLLHTWSLAVEEQFYVIFPFLLLISLRWKRATFLEILICFWVASFILSVFGTPMFPTLGFYFLPMRAWELLTGALLAAGQRNLSTGRIFRETSGWLGLGLMLYAILFYDRHTHFPGLPALAPCLGAALFMLSSQGETSLVGRIFSFKPVVFIGLVSYSLYLWHWPLLVFSRYLATDELSRAFRLGLLAASLGLAIASWKWIETPVRQRRFIKPRWQLFGCAAGCMVLFISLGLLINARQGWPERLTPQARNYLNSNQHIPFRADIVLSDHGPDLMPELGSRSTNDPVFIMICGDSHAMSVTPAIDELCRKYSRRGKQATLSATPQLIGHVKGDGFSKPNGTPTQADIILDYAARNHVRNVIFTARWTLYSDAHGFETNLVLTVRRFLASGTKVYLLEDTPEPGFDVPRLAAVTAMNGRDVDALTFSAAKYETEKRRQHRAFDLARRQGAIILDPTPEFVGSDQRCHVARDQKLLYWDNNHLTADGSKLLLPLFEPIFKTD